MMKKQITLAHTAETGRIGITFLKRFWSFYTLQRTGQTNGQSAQLEFNISTALLNALGLGLEPTIQFVFNHAPTFEGFEDWVMANGQISEETIQLFNALILGENQNNTLEKEPLVLEEKDLIHWERDGYVIIRNAILKTPIPFGLQGLLYLVDTAADQGPFL